MILKYRVHKGVVLDVSKHGFDAGAATFGTAFYDEDSGELYLFYTGAYDTNFTRASIGLAISTNFLSFRKLSEPVLSCEELNFKEALTPTVFRVGNYFYMAFACRPFKKGRRICLAFSDDPKGPWNFIKVVAKPEHLWEGNNIDLGPSSIKVSENEVLIYYSNVVFYAKRYQILFYLTREHIVGRLNYMQRTEFNKLFNLFHRIIAYPYCFYYTFSE